MIRDWRLAPVKHADETGWRGDGRNGYTHGFFTPDISLFRCRLTRIQNIFRETAHRLYHWAKDRSIPAENNLAERALRPLVIARTISFGSQSEKGLPTREILMTILGTLAKRTDHAVDAFVRLLDAVAENPALAIEDFLFGPQGIAPPRTPNPLAARQA